MWNIVLKDESIFNYATFELFRIFEWTMYEEALRFLLADK